MTVVFVKEEIVSTIRETDDREAAMEAAQGMSRFDVHDARYMVLEGGLPVASFTLGLEQIGMWAR